MTRQISQDRCRFCAIASGEIVSPWDTPIAMDDKYFSVASVGGFASGWALLCPREHQHNFASHYTDDAFHHALGELVERVELTYGKAVVFEHGSIREGSATACGTNHAHIHAVPFSGDLALLAMEADTSLEWEAASLREISDLANGNEYLFAANRYDGDRTLGYLALLHQPRSQFFRHVLARALGVPHLANYRDAPLETLSTSTSVRLREAPRGLACRAA